MSTALESAVAVVSCVSGLSQAFDASCRVIQRIKAHRQKVHGEVPGNLALLEESLQKAKREIEDFVLEGVEQFGSDFTIGDTPAQLALFRLTVDVQNALLEGLVAARANDDVDGLDNCNNSLERCRNEVLDELQLFYQRRLVEVAEHSAQAARKIDVPKETSPTQSKISSKNTAPGSITNLDPKRRRGLFRGFNKFERASPPAYSPNLAQRGTRISRTPISSVDGSDKASLISSLSSATTLVDASFGNYRGLEKSKLVDSLNSPTTLTNAAVENHIKLCKYANRVCESGLHNAFELHNPAWATILVYECRSVRCKFRLEVSQTEKGVEIDNRLCTSHGIGYRPIFFAKSHIAQEKVTNIPSFLCLICSALGKRSEVYRGRGELLSHIVQHKERVIGDCPLEGPVVFIEGGVTSSSDFDLVLPDFDLRSATTAAENSGAILDTMSPTGFPEPSTDNLTIDAELSKERSSSDDDLVYNPWSSSIHKKSPPPFLHSTSTTKPLTRVVEDLTKQDYENLKTLGVASSTDECSPLISTDSIVQVSPKSSLTAEFRNALHGRDTLAVHKQLKSYFNIVASGDYSWLHELREAGYGYEELADLLLEDICDGPWIYFSSSSLANATVINPDYHVLNCVHSGSCLLTSLPSQDVVMNGSNSPQLETGIRRIIQESCGLAGVTPTSRNVEDWNGAVDFDIKNLTAVVSCPPYSKDFSKECRRVIEKSLRALQGFCTAAARAQQASFCCDCFTILLKTAESINSRQNEADAVEMLHIKLVHGSMISEELLRLSKIENIVKSDLDDCLRLCWAVLLPLSDHRDPIGERFHNTGEILHLIALTTQFLCLGFLSYSQAHIGAIQPFYLDSPLKAITLQGIYQTTETLPYISASLVELTCMSKMTRGPVFTFSLIRTQQPMIPQDDRKYDLVASGENILDTWGPGYFVYEHDHKGWVSAIYVGGGLITVVDAVSDRLHWNNGVELPAGHLKSFYPGSSMRIGTTVTVNPRCLVDELICRKKSSTALEPLGTQCARWELQEREFGVQAGPQYFFGTFNHTFRKIAALTLKQRQMLQLQQNIEHVIPFLEQTWGLQVSICTTVARRVPLRELVADMLPIFARSSLESGLWETYERQYCITEALCRTDAHSLLLSLPEDGQKHVLQLIKNILERLQSTGVDYEGKHLLIAWPKIGDIDRCLKVPCTEQTSWARMLADSEDCATFAYMTSKCLESSKVKCKGPEPRWRSASALLATAVSLARPIPPEVPWSLEHKKLYFIKKGDTLFKVRVVRQNDVIMLIASYSTIPSRIQERLFRKGDWERNFRIREQQMSDDPAEQVIVLAEDGGTYSIR